jgi:hypothetical protein
LKLIEYLQEIWHWDDYVVWKDNILELHTGGWSGNEEIVQVLEETFFWYFYWQKSERGGHYYFEVPERFLIKEGDEHAMDANENPATSL